MRINVEFFDLDKIADSGQCFRWKKTGDRAYQIPAFGKILNVRHTDGGEVELDCSPKEYREIWEGYFDLLTPYERYEQELRTRSDTGEYLYSAARAARGIRILRQDLWEVILSFIISQNNNIPRIKRSIEKLCERFGGFPDAWQIAMKGPGGLEGLGLGYRKNYIVHAALSYFGDGDGSMGRILESLTCEDAMRYLKTWPGIGPKVASCICLYGLGHKEAFPRDVWVKRIEAEHFGGRFPEEDYPGFAGVLQQYIFYYERSRHGIFEKNTRIDNTRQAAEGGMPGMRGKA